MVRICCLRPCAERYARAVTRQHIQVLVFPVNGPDNSVTDQVGMARLEAVDARLFAEVVQDLRSPSHHTSRLKTMWRFQLSSVLGKSVR